MFLSIIYLSKVELTISNLVFLYDLLICFPIVSTICVIKELTSACVVFLVFRGNIDISADSGMFSAVLHRRELKRAFNVVTVIMASFSFATFRSPRTVIILITWEKWLPLYYSIKWVLKEAIIEIILQSITEVNGGLSGR